uniref:Uncharacterized protein n=1 Tax=Mycena chlorophos TaxID=658473 RepID=A0ABQ0M1I8_MYCCL|nr:predicted protein [Mycena chlorophos]
MQPRIIALTARGGNAIRFLLLTVVLCPGTMATLRRSNRTRATRTIPDNAMPELDESGALAEKENEAQPITAKRKRVPEKVPEAPKMIPAGPGLMNEVPQSPYLPMTIDNPMEHLDDGDDAGGDETAGGEEGGHWLHRFGSEEAFSDDDDDDDEAYEGASEHGLPDEDEEMLEAEVRGVEDEEAESNDGTPKRDPKTLELTIVVSVMHQTETTKAQRKKKLKTVMLSLALSGLTFPTLLKAVLRKVSKSTGSDLSRNKDYDLEFTVPRIHTSSTELDIDTFRTLISKAKKIKAGPEAKITMTIPQPDVAVDDDDDEEDAGKGRKRKKSRTGPPKERDLDSANQPINDKIALLRAKYKGSYVDPETAKEVVLGNAQYECWAEAWEAGNCNEHAPPNHALFDPANPRNRKSALQVRAEQQAAARAGPVLPPIQVTIVGPDAAGPKVPSAAAEKLIPADKETATFSRLRDSVISTSWVTRFATSCWTMDSVVRRPSIC